MRYKNLRQREIDISNHVADVPNAADSDGSDGNTHHLASTTDEEDDVYPTQISYPIDMDSTCDCVTFPDVDIDEDNVSDCSVGMTWASFQIYFSEAECVNLQFDDSEVYQNCPSDVSQTDEYILCVIDFTEDSSDDGSMTSQSSSAMSATTSTSNSNDGKSTTDESSSLNLSPTETASQTSDSSQSTTNLNDGAGPSSLANNLAKPTMTRMLSMMVVLLLQ